MWKIKKGKNNLTFLCLSSLVSESSTCFHDGKANPWSPCWLPCHLPFLTSSSSRDKMLQLYSKMPGTERELKLLYGSRKWREFVNEEQDNILDAAFYSDICASVLAELFN